MLEAKDLCLSHQGRLLLDSVNLSVGKGQVHLVLGENGAGKSLLLRCLMGLILPSAGQVLGLDVRRQAYLQQRPSLLRRSVLKNIEFALGVQSKPLREAQKALRDFALEPLQNQRADTLSVGQQQRLALARACALEPDILLLDEPSSALDPASRAFIHAALLRLKAGGKSLVLVTHDLSLASGLGGTVHMFEEGRICEQTPAQKFFGAPTSEAGKKFLSRYRFT